MKVVVGVDSGGSTTRALAVSLGGERVGYAEGGGGNLSHDRNGRENVRSAIIRAGVGHEIVRVVAGIAGYDGKRDEDWVREATEVPGAPARTVVNDGVVAHAGALEGRPGIVTIQGTGSNVLAVLPDGRRVTNGDFMHYACAGAVRVGIAAVQRLLTADAFEDDGVREAIFREWEVDSVEGLRETVVGQGALAAVERSRRFGMIARAVTTSSSAIAAAVLDTAAGEVVTGIRLLGGLFGTPEVEVALIGACVRSPAMRSRVVAWLGEGYRVVEPALPPVVGAVLMALREEGVEAPKGRAAGWF